MSRTTQSNRRAALAPPIEIERRILFVRGHKVVLDADLASLYGVTTKRLNEQVRRNVERFPLDFMFQLTNQEVMHLRSQFATSNSTARGGRRYRPYAFTEHGALMAANVLNSTRAVEASVYVVRAFVRLREMISTHKELALKLDELEKKFATHDRAIAEVIAAIRQLTAAPEPKRRGIGFVIDKD